MMVIDCNASAGYWPSRPPMDCSVAAVAARLQDLGVDRAFVASLESAWCRNPHAPNQELVADAALLSGVSPVPTLDPTVHTWRDELANLGRMPNVRMVRLLPAYSPYPLYEADEMLEEIRLTGLAVQIQTRLDDPRRQHPLAQVPDVPAAEVVAIARRHPSVTVVIGGARFVELRALKDEILDLNRLYADTSQCDSMDAVRVLCEDGLRDRLLYGSHAMLFDPVSGLRRVVDDLDDETAALILGGNAQRALWPN
ncbi:MAG: hypothetical protein HUU35_07815 [Armatimonadetes bacterium]|nr:hypothetical protein [Armatimonadota bacterium]